MLKESKKSVRVFFVIISVLSFLMGAGAISQILLFLRENPGANLSFLFMSQTAFRFLLAIIFGYVALKFPLLIKEKPKTIKGILHLNFWGSIAFSIVYIISDAKINFLGLAISVLVYVYLMKSVDRLSKEGLEPKVA